MAPPSSDDAAARPTLADLSEGDVLARILPRMRSGADALIGPGDDAAVVRAEDGRFVVTTDMMVHGPDFRLAWSTPFELGWKAAATNLSDVAAMGARPTALVVAIAAPSTTPVDVLEGIADGLTAGCAALSPGCGIVGGDLSASATLTLAITAFGSLDGRDPVLRSGAHPGDIVAVAGVLGHAGAGLRLLFERGRRDGEADAELADGLRERHPEVLAAQLAPAPPIAAGTAAGGRASAMMDVSDGLVLDGRRMATASGVLIDFDSAAIDAAASPLTSLPGIDAAVARTLVLGGGEDHAMLACFPPGVALPDGFEQIGRVGEGGPEVLLDGHPLHDRFGWDPYLGWDGGVG
ncbi:thiamine-phosphate kinase [Microbacteriaceae bacterium VKM Ac-2855]|nr:thiamine-phosphate kinase [Microbacteriaceae bacterium VKM Ac-2855]